MFHCHNLIHEDRDMMVAMRSNIGGGDKFAGANVAAGMKAGGLVYNNASNTVYSDW